MVWGMLVCSVVGRLQWYGVCCCVMWEIGCSGMGYVGVYCGRYVTVVWGMLLCSVVGRLQWCGVCCCVVW